jgi:hypothetical protein
LDIDGHTEALAATSRAFTLCCRPAIISFFALCFALIDLRRAGESEVQEIGSEKDLGVAHTGETFYVCNTGYQVEPTGKGKERRKRNSCHRGLRPSDYKTTSIRCPLTIWNLSLS